MSSSGGHRTALYGWLAAQAVSITGTRVSMIASPWFVLTTTGSATQTGLVAFAEMAPLVALKALAGPLVDRVGPRKVAIVADVASAVVIGTVPLLWTMGSLSFPVLLGLVAVAGALRGPGDGAKQAMVPALVAAANVPLERATGLGAAVERTASMLGAALAGGLVALVGAVDALVVDAASFVVSAALLAAFTRGLRPGTAAAGSSGAAPARTSPPAYRAQLREGWDFLRHDPVLLGIALMLTVTNLLDMAYSAVLVPVWARETGAGAAAIGVLFAVWGGCSAVGAVAAATWATRLPRYWTYLVAFLVAGAPKFWVLGAGTPLWGVLVTAAVGGVASGFVNPVLGAVSFERIPSHLVGRVSSLSTALSWSTIPLGGVVGGLLIGGIGLAPTLVACGGAYFLTTMVPAVMPSWREMDRRPAHDAVPQAVA